MLLRHADVRVASAMADHARVEDGLVDWGHACKRGWVRWTRLIEGDHKMVAPDHWVTGITGGDPKTVAASAGKDGSMRTIGTVPACVTQRG